jgi:hypothetical protein
LFRHLPPENAGHGRLAFEAVTSGKVTIRIDQRCYKLEDVQQATMIWKPA